MKKRIINIFLLITLLLGVILQENLLFSAEEPQLSKHSLSIDGEKKNEMVQKAETYFNQTNKMKGYIHQIKKTKDNGYIIVGGANDKSIANPETNQPGWGHAKLVDAIMIKLDENLVVQWAMRAGGVGNESFNDVIELGDGNFVAALTTNNSGRVYNADGSNSDFTWPMASSANLNTQVVLVKVNTS